jgi:hypothetical protein
VECNDPHEGHGRVCEGDRARVGVSHVYFETLVYKIQTPGNYPEENIQQPYVFVPYLAIQLCNVNQQNALLKLMF